MLVFWIIINLLLLFNYIYNIMDLILVNYKINILDFFIFNNNIIIYKNVGYIIMLYNFI